ncbi:MAG: T9SS type A sorting domain-containing protein [Crocinitomix sp.]|nr:T9SS type A sorting domain-containing protein [Crocinitomix sp.]
MKKITLVLTLALLSAATYSQAQQHIHKNDSDINLCGETVETKRLMAEYPEYAAMQAEEDIAFQAAYEEYMEYWSPDDRSLYVIPVVVHVVHLGGAENISDAQVFSGIEQMNLDFNMENPDVGGTIPEFADIVGNCNIEFRLATIDPEGNCHSGITRTYSETTYDVGNSGPSNHPIVDAVEDEHGTWPQNKYMNIFCCADPNGNGGYTFRPTNWFPSGRMYGSIFLRADYMGIIGTSTTGRRHTLSHEAGHWLNLSHPWGNNNNPGNAASCGSDDSVADTPNTIGWDNCSDVYGETCGTLDNVQNIMDYSYCSTMFSEGQAARAQTALLGTQGQRYKLSAATNLVNTGTDGPGDICEAIFSSDLRSICAGTTVMFTDNSYHSVTSRSWTFEGGSPATSTSENPSITYDTPGVYEVSLEVSGGGDSESTTDENYIVVLPNPGTTIPYKEGFETLSDLPDYSRFIVENETNDVTWELTTTAASSGSKSALLGNYGVSNGSKDALVSGTIDLSGVDEDDDIIFNFKYAYKRRSSDDDEWLRFYVSNDCGETWALRKNIHGDDLGPAVTGSEFLPGAWDWRQVNITNIFPDYFVSTFRFKIEFENDNGNNIFVDDINLYPSSMTSLVDQDIDFGVKVYPNPLAGQATLELVAKAGQDYNVTLHNALGEKITVVHNGALTEGKNQIQWATDNLAKGIYILRIESDGQVQTLKLVKD